MDYAVSFINSVVRIWLDSGVLIPALLTGYYFSDRTFWNFLGINAVVAVVDHVLITVLYRLGRTAPGKAVMDTFMDKIAERIVAFIMAALAVYGIIILLRRLILSKSKSS